MLDGILHEIRDHAKECPSSSDMRFIAIASSENSSLDGTSMRVSK